MPSSAPDVSVPTSLDVYSGSAPATDALSQSEGLPEGSAQSSPDSFTDSYTHITASPDEAPASPLTTETLGAEEASQEGEELPQDEERLPKEGEQLPVNGAGLRLDEEESELSGTTSDIGKQAGMEMIAGKLMPEKKTSLCVCVILYLVKIITWCPLLKPCVLFVFEVYLVDQLVMELFSIWARKLSGEAVVGMRQGA